MSGRAPSVTNATAAYVTTYLAYAYLVNRYEGDWWVWGTGHSAVDVWTFKHAMWGALARGFGVSLPQLVQLAVANEVGEHVLRHARPTWFHGSETAANVAIDFAALLAGYELAGDL